MQRRRRGGDRVRARRGRPWDFRRAERPGPVACLGLDAFSAPTQAPGGGRAEGRTLYTATRYTPGKERHHYRVDFGRDPLAGQLRRAAAALGLDAAGRRIALTGAGNGREAALRRHSRDDPLCIPDRYHASQRLRAFAAGRSARDPPRRAAWADRAKGVLYEQGGAALLTHLRGLPPPGEAGVADELRKLIDYFAGNARRADYPEYRRQGWDLGSGPTEAACKVVGARLKQSGMRWLEPGAVTVAPLRALYRSGPDVWDAFRALAA